MYAFLLEKLDSIIFPVYFDDIFDTTEIYEALYKSGQQAYEHYLLKSNIFLFGQWSIVGDVYIII